MAQELAHIQHLVRYANWAYLGSDGTEFRMNAADLKGSPVCKRVLNVVTPFWRDIGTSLTPDTHVHLGIRHDDTLVLVFRGMDSMQKLENLVNPQRWWGLASNMWTSINYSLTGIDWLSGSDADEVLVHEGFLLAFNSLLRGEHLQGSIIELCAEPGGPKKIEICGHGLGGALAALGALWCHTMWPQASITCVTLGAPRVGNVNFSALIDKAGINCYRIANDSDPIPTIPDRYSQAISCRLRPSLPLPHVSQTYQHAGRPIWLHSGEKYRRPQAFPINPPHVELEERGGELPRLFRLVLRAGGWIPYWYQRILRTGRNIPYHDPSRYVDMIQRIIEDANQAGWKK